MSDNPHRRLHPLVVVDRWPLPHLGGARQRLVAIIDAVAAVDAVFTIVVVAAPDPERAAQLRERYRDATIEHVEPVRRTRRAKRLHQVRGHVPADINIAATARRLAMWHHRAAWVVSCFPVPNRIVRQLRAHNPSGRRPPWFADLNDLDFVRLARQPLLADDTPPSPLRRRWRQWTIRSWTTYASDIGTTADMVAVCSDIDAAALRAIGCRAALVVPNGTHVPLPTGDNDAAQAATTVPSVHIVYVGQLTYPPNVAAAVRLVERILPIIRRTHPQARVTLVGRAGPAVRRLAGGNVVVTGVVTDVGPYLDDADVTVVALSDGGGTRIKILEAMAHRVPVVSTTVGAEGLDVDDRVHLLIRDVDAEIAAAAIAVATDPVVRTPLVDAAEALVNARYSWPTIVAQLTKRLTDLRRQADV